MKKLLYENKHFLLPYLVFLLMFVALVPFYTKAEMHIWANQFHSPFFDYLFSNITNLGDRITVIIAGIILLFISYRYTIAFTIGTLITSSIVHLFKQVLMAEALRPSKYFLEIETYQLYLIEGYKLQGEQSFPSGHTSSAFNIFFLLALITKNKSLKLVYFILALAVAFSRVYLSMHFFIDTVVGSLIAVISVLMVFRWVQTWEASWLDGSIIKKSGRT